MSKFSLICSLVSGVVLSTSVFADGRFEQHAKDVANQLNLNTEKSQLLLDAMSRHHEEREQLRKAEKNDQYEHHKFKRAMHEKHRNEIKNLLSLSEFEAFERIMFFKRKHNPMANNNRGKKY